MNKAILRLAIPNILSNVSIPLLSTVDTALMGQLSELHIGAVGLGAMIFNFIYWNFGFLRMGTTGMTAQANGKQEEQAIINTLGRALIVALFVAMLLLLLQYPIAQLSLSLLHVTEQQTPILLRYFSIRIWAAPASLMLYGLLGWYFGMQNAVYPLLVTILINVLNILISYVFVIHYGLEISGVAYGTVLAQYAGLIVALGLFWYKYRPYLSKFNQRLLWRWESFKRFLVINRDIFIRTLCLTFAIGFFFSQSSSAGDTILAANVILFQFMHWMSYGVDGFAYATESLVGTYVGANNKRQTLKAIRYAFAWGMLLAALYSFTYWMFGQNILPLFTRELSVIQAAQPYLVWLILLPLLSTPCYIWDGVFIGLTASKAMRNSMIISLFIYLVLFYTTYTTLGNHGLWLAMTLFLVARGLIQWGLFWKKGLELN